MSASRCSKLRMLTSCACEHERNNVPAQIVNATVVTEVLLPTDGGVARGVDITGKERLLILLGARLRRSAVDKWIDRS
eukprot:1194721-Prorocentrum_minimum.AAC.5